MELFMVSHRAFPALLVLCCVSPAVHAQYRNNGLYAEVGVETHEHAPWTLSALATSALGVAAYREGRTRKLVPYNPALATNCAQRLVAGQGGLPCRHDWWGITDGPVFGVGFQRVLGDLWLDLREVPVLSNLVFSGRTSISPVMTLPFHQGFFRPAALWHGELGLRWNILDERWRPFVGVALVLSAFLDPVGTFLRTATMDRTCQRQDNGEALRADEVCVRDGGVQPPGSPVALNSSHALYGLNNLPLFGGVRPEAGLEYFFAEDVSIQATGSVAVHVTPVPRYVLNAPFLGLGARGTVGVVAYF
jgi:hypothetical protein